LGAAYLIMGLAGVGARVDVPESGTYAGSGMAGAATVPGNPFEANPFPGMNYQTEGFGHRAIVRNGRQRGGLSLDQPGGRKPSGGSEPPDGTRESHDPSGGGFGLSATGTF
jgi:hypothetical protein